jgi:hypothetical protein
MATPWIGDNKFVVGEGARRLRIGDDYAARCGRAGGGDAAGHGGLVVGVGGYYHGWLRGHDGAAERWRMDQTMRRRSRGMGSGVLGSVDGRARSAGVGTYLDGRRWKGGEWG